MILFCADIHLGIRSYSLYDRDGLSTAEHEGRKALQEIYERASKPDITCLIIGGDVFHTNLPTSRNIRFVIDWLQKVDKIGIPVFIIPGNHDCSGFSHSMVFIHSLQLKNINLLDTQYSIQKEYKWNDWNLVFIPYIAQESLKDKEALVHTIYKNRLETLKEKTIVVSHIQETSSKMGSESVMINRGVEVYDVANIQNTENLILLLGHIHKPQIYKKGFATICYPGNAFYHDSSDRNQIKGYALVTPKGGIFLEPLHTIRKFYEINSLPLNSEIDYKDQVLFFRLAESKSSELREEIERLSKEKGFIIGEVVFKDIEEEATNLEQILQPDSEPNLIRKVLEDKLVNVPEAISIEKVLQESITYFEKLKEKEIEKEKA